jgi:exodeoxyribonuclease-3
MKIVTININGIRASYKKGLFEYLQKLGADVVCLQEVRANEDQLSEDFYPKGYHHYYQSAKKKGYSGVAIFSKQKPDKISISGWNEVDNEGRFLRADFGDLSVISAYIPSGSSSEERQNFKMQMMNQHFLPWFEKIKDDKQKYIICGDVNIVHKKRDIKNFNGNKNRSGCLPEEREYLDNLFDNIGFIDAFREVNNEEHQYTWWSNRGQAWANNTGWRIDYQILSPNLKGSVLSSSVYKDERFSDHAPLVVDYNFK